MVGWSAYQALRQHHQVRVICSASGAQAIEKAIQSGEAEKNDFHFIPERWSYIGHPAADKLINWFNTFYFQKTLACIGPQEIRDFQPDVIHQVTIATWRAGNPFSGMGPPFIWGPVGGGEKLPLSFLGTFSAYSAFFEILRIFSGIWAQGSQAVRRTAQKADWIFAGNSQTACLLHRLRGRDACLEILPVVAFPKKKMAEFKPRSASSGGNRPIQIFSGGYVEARKGIGLAIRALARLKAGGHFFQYEHGGIGPERAHLQNQIYRLGLQDCVRIVDPYGGESYREKLRSADIFLFPSLRDNCPISLLEAMGHGCVPVVADHAGPGEIVTSECGVKIPVTRPDAFVDQLTKELGDLFHDASRRQYLAEGARKRVFQTFSQENWLQRVEAAYRIVAKGR